MREPPGASWCANLACPTPRANEQRGVASLGRGNPGRFRGCACNVRTEVAQQWQWLCDRDLGGTEARRVPPFVRCESPKQCVKRNAEHQRSSTRARGFAVCGTRWNTTSANRGRPRCTARPLRLSQAMRPSGPRTQRDRLDPHHTELTPPSARGRLCVSLG